MLPTDGTSPPRQTRQTLPRSRRILRREDFLRVQEGGVRVTTRHLLILLAPRVYKTEGETLDDETRLGIVASRKMGASVRRNRAKRLVRETFRRNLDLFPPNVDLVVIVRSGLEALSQADVEAEIVGVASLLRKRASGKATTGRSDRGPSKARS